MAAANVFWSLARTATDCHAATQYVRKVTPIRIHYIFSVIMVGFPPYLRLSSAYYGESRWVHIPAKVSSSLHFTHTAVVSKSNSTKSPASGAGKVSESWLMPNVKRVREFCVSLDGCISAVREVGKWVLYYWQLSCDWGRRKGSYVSLALNVVMLNVWDFFGLKAWRKIFPCPQHEAINEERRCSATYTLTSTIDWGELSNSRHCLFTLGGKNGSH
jgi:hypothetical protein